MLIEAILILAATSAPVTHGSAVFDPPNRDRWELRNPEESPSSASCFDESRDGVVRCVYRHRGLVRRMGYALRRHFSIMDDRLNGPTYLLVDLQPLVCPAEELLRKAPAWMTERAAQRWRGDETLELEVRPERLFVGGTRTRRLALAVTDYDSVWVDLHVPTGVRTADARDFDALVASIRSTPRPHGAFRRAALLQHRFGSVSLLSPPPTCSPSEEERVRRMTAEFELATREDPNDWRPWVELAELSMEQHIGYSFETQMGYGRLGLGISDVWHPLTEGPGLERRDPVQLGEVARLYGEAARRSPPALDGWPSGDLRASDLAGVLAWQARHLAEAGDVEGAARVYRRALDEGTLGSWGVLEASLWLGERAYQSGDRRRALELYLYAWEAWEAYWPEARRFLTDQIPTFHVIKDRLRELEADESLKRPR